MLQLVEDKGYLTKTLVDRAHVYEPAQRRQQVISAMVRDFLDRVFEALLLFADAAPLSPAPAFAPRRHLFRRMMLISKEAVMSSTRVVLSSAAMAVAVIAGGWYAVAMFPLTQVVYAQGRSGGPAAVTSGGAGPLERRAKPITPENPIPRRIFSVPPQNPGDNASGVVLVGLRLTIDGQGRVAEVRSVGGGGGGRFFMGGLDATARDDRLQQERAQSGTVGVATWQQQQGVIRPPSESFVKAAIDAVRQWQYDPPADGPIAFDVTFQFAAGSEARLISHGDSRPALRFVPPPPPPAPIPEGAVRVGGNVTLPRKVKDVPPVYPPIAQSARVQGVVIAELVIGPGGRVQAARVLRSIPLLDEAALEAVKQWEFAPTLLNGKAVPVVMTAAVQFVLP